MVKSLGWRARGAAAKSGAKLNMVFYPGAL